MAAEEAGGSPDVVHFLWSLVTASPDARQGLGSAQHSLHVAPLHGSGSFPRTEQDLSLCRLHSLGAGVGVARGVVVSLSSSISAPRGSFRTAVLNPQSTMTHDVLMQDTLLWAHPNYEETLSPKMLTST